MTAVSNKTLLGIIILAELIEKKLNSFEDVQVYPASLAVCSDTVSCTTGEITMRRYNS